MAMREGAFMMIDALGFKGIWNKAQPAEVLRKLRQLRDGFPAGLEVGMQKMAAATPALPPLKVEVAFLSDTVVASAAFTHDAIVDIDRWRAIATLAGIASTFTPISCASPVWTYRGCITYGRFEVDKEFIVGPAVDEAASLASLAEAAAVWLAPSAFAATQAFERTVPPANLEEAPWIRYGVPLKNGATYETKVVNPFWYGSDAQAAAWRTTLLQSFASSRIEVAIKQQNTARFFERAFVTKRSSMRPTDPQS